MYYQSLIEFKKLVDKSSLGGLFELRERLDASGKTGPESEIDLFIMVPLGISEFSNGLFKILEHTGEKLKEYLKRLKRAGSHNSQFHANYVKEEEDDSALSDI
jgi:hypothetical protein